MLRARMARGVKVFPCAVTEGWSGAFWANAVAPMRNTNSFGIKPPAVPESDTHVFVEPVRGALPGLVGRDFVVTFRSRITIEAVNSAGVDIAFMRNVGCFQGHVIRRPSGCQ